MTGRKRFKVSTFMWGKALPDHALPRIGGSYIFDIDSDWNPGDG